MNLWVGIGNLGHDPVLRSTPSGKSVLNLSLAINRTYTRQQEDGSTLRTSATDWIPVVVWGKQAEHQANHLSKGTKIAVTGAWRQRTYEDKDGKSVTSYEVHATNIDWLSK